MATQQRAPSATALSIYSVFALFLPGIGLAQDLEIYHIDVEQGDATLFVTPSGRSLLVDSGKNGHGARIKAVMDQAGIAGIDHFVATHYHEDHYGGIDDLVDEEAVPITNAYDRGDKAFLPVSRTGGETYISYDDALGHRAVHLLRGEMIALDPELVVVCIASGGAVLAEQPSEHGIDENDASIALLVQFGDFRYFIGGDIEAHTERQIAENSLVEDVDVYQANHHGSHTSSSLVFLEAIRPNVVIISNGNNALFKHPRHVTLERLQSLDQPPSVFQTNKFLGNSPGDNVEDEFIADVETADLDGTIRISVDMISREYRVRYGTTERVFVTKSRVSSPADIVIASLIPNPVGDDRQNEIVTLKNNGDVGVDISSWLLRDKENRVWSLSNIAQIEPGSKIEVMRSGMPMSLNNGGDTIDLLDETGSLMHRVTYPAVAEGVRVKVSD